MAEEPKSRRKAEPPQRQSLSEISHLFLTELRERQGGAAPGAARPQRKPPAAITPKLQEESEPAKRPRVSGVLAHHLAGNALSRVRDYVRHAAAAGRVGLIELGEQGLRLSCYDASPEKTEAPVAAEVEPVDGQRIRQTIEEMNWDIERWIIFLPGGARSEMEKEILSRVDQWTVLAEANDEGTVAAYRTIKGVSATVAESSLSLGVFGADDDAHGELIHRKLAGACTQFLGRDVKSEGRIAAGCEAAEHVVLWCRASAGGSQEHWKAILELTETPAAEVVEAVEPPPQPSPGIPGEGEEPETISMKITPTEPRAEEAEVLDLAAGDAASILKAVIEKQGQWVSCPIKPPMGAAAVAVDRGGNLTLVAVAADGLGELQTISRAYGWLIENRALVCMALPQMKIDSAATPKLALFVDQAGASADQLGAIVQSGTVTIHTYRRLRWGEKTGLLLAAA
jgi:hypothetical protein